MNMNDPLLSRKELASVLKRSRVYVWWMERRGFKFVAGRARESEALAWLSSQGKGGICHFLDSVNIR